MAITVYDPIFKNVGAARRKEIQEEFGRHLIEQRNRMAGRIREWIETDKRFPIPIYDELVGRIRQLDPCLRKDVASVALLMADEIAWAMLTMFGTGDDTRIDGRVVNYTIIAQIRDDQSTEVVEQVDIDRGAPVISLAKEYKHWLSRYSPSALRPIARSGATSNGSSIEGE